MKRCLLMLLIGLIGWMPLAPAWAADAELIRLPAEARLETLAPAALAVDPFDRSDLWTNATYALAGSALANLLLIALIGGLSAGHEALAPDSGPLIDLWGPSALALELVPLVATPVLMQAWSPDAEYAQFGASLIGSLSAGLVQILLMVPLFFAFRQDTASATVFVLMPIALITAILFQALGAAWGHELGQNLQLSSDGQGLSLSYRWRY